MGSPQSPEHGSKIWKAALQRYYDELANGGYKGHVIDKELWDIKDPEELLNQIRSLPASDRGPEELKALKKVLVGLSDFVAVAAWALGMNGRVAAVIWGSIRLLLVVSQCSIAPLRYYYLTFAAFPTSFPKGHSNVEGSGNNFAKVQELRRTPPHDASVGRRSL